MPTVDLVYIGLWAPTKCVRENGCWGIELSMSLALALMCAITQFEASIKNILIAI